ncbi:MAG: guanosine polyphosphate pyrophosphohydrolase [Saccharofermentans sp.]|nr:guanosine polyphosphate pyrophosphohydrolase [Saccharofermentans sp.]
MISLNDYLYSGNTVLKIMQLYSHDLHENAIKNNNPIDQIHSEFLLRIIDLLEHNDFLTSQSQRIREFYKYMAYEYPFLAFTFKGRIKSLIRAEQKFNGYVVNHIYHYYKEHGKCPDVGEVIKDLGFFRDLIAYRIVISIPSCHLKPGDDRKEVEKKYLYEIANKLPEFLGREGFKVQISESDLDKCSPYLKEDLKGYYRDYVEYPTPYGYQSLHATFFDEVSQSYIEVQLRTKAMDDYAEIGPANHLGYEKRQDNERSRRDLIPVGDSIYFDEAYERGILLQQIDLSEIDVNMFGAVSNALINDGCGLYRGRLILPFEHLSRFQNDLVD